MPMNDEKLSQTLEEQPFLTKGDILFKEGGPCLYAPSDWHARAWGFKRAADILAEHVLANWTGGDLMIYPIIFLYRHHLELSLKEIIIKGNELLDEQIKLKNVHSLCELWSDCRTVLQRIDVAIDIPATEAFEANIRQLDQIDPESMSFRYPVTKNGTPTLPTSLDSVDLQNMQKVVHRMSFFLEITRDLIVERTGNL